MGIPQLKVILKVKELIGYEATVLEDAEVAVVGDDGVGLGTPHVPRDNEVRFPPRNTVQPHNYKVKVKGKNAVSPHV